MSVLDIITLLVFLAALFDFINVKYIKLPSTIGLMLLSLLGSLLLAGVGLVYPEIYHQAEAIIDGLDFSEVLMHIMLSFLLFAGALHVNIKKLFEEKWSILTLATLGVATSTLLIGSLIYYILPFVGLQMNYIYCLLFGALISPTDPIAVLSMVKKHKISKNLEIKIAGESLFNDGIGVVVFLTILSIVEVGSENVTASDVSILFAKEVFGGVFIGVVFGYLGMRLLNVLDNEEVIEVLITLALVMTGTSIAEHLHFSAPLAMVVLGLFLSKEGKVEFLQKITGDYVYKFWSLIDEMLNAMLFVLIGFEVLIISLDISHIIAGLIAIAITLISRFISVSVPISIFRLKRKFSLYTIRILTWGGLRGGISVALALSLPDSEEKDIIVAITYIVVVFSILVQGLTIGKLFSKASE